MPGERGFNPDRERETRKRSYYEILGVPVNATDEEIRAAYWKMAKESHPDLFPGDKSKEEEMKLINEAFAILRDKQKRNRYDYFANIKGNPDTGSGAYSSSKEDSKTEAKSEPKHKHDRNHFWGGVGNESPKQQSSEGFDDSNEKEPWDKRTAEKVRAGTEDAMRKGFQKAKEGLNNIKNKTGSVIKQVRDVTGPPEKSGPERLAELRVKKTASEKKKQERLEEFRKKRHNKKK